MRWHWKREWEYVLSHIHSQGVAHVLEHTVLCGSAKYPVRDPFFNMLKYESVWECLICEFLSAHMYKSVLRWLTHGRFLLSQRRSLNTYMNAWTAADYTMYPFSTQNQKGKGGREGRYDFIIYEHFSWFICVFFELVIFVLDSISHFSFYSHTHIFLHNFQILTISWTCTWTRPSILCWTNSTSCRRGIDWRWRRMEGRGWGEREWYIMKWKVIERELLSFILSLKNITFISYLLFVILQSYFYHLL